MADQVRLDQVGDLITALTTEHVTAFMSADGESGHATVMKIIEAVLTYLGAPVVLEGDWDASEGTFPGGGEAKKGWSYIVTTAGTVDGVEFNVNDRLIAKANNASATTYEDNWFKADYTDQVLSVAGLTGAISAAALRTALNLAAIATSGSASDLSTGTVPNAVLPARIGTTAQVLTDYNAALDSGLYYGNDAANGPVPGGLCLCVVETLNVNYTTQTAHEVVTDGPASTKIWRRSKNVGVWSAWYQMRLSQVEQAALWTSIADLASTDPGKGAALVGVEAIDGLPGVTNVQGALETLASGDSAIGAALAALPFGDVGTVAMVKITGGPNPGAGGNVDGQYVVYSGLSASTGDAAPVGSTWQLMGNISASGGSSGSVTLAKRVE